MTATDTLVAAATAWCTADAQQDTAESDADAAYRTYRSAVGTDVAGKAQGTVAEAVELHDALTRELGEPQALTDREAMVWAVAYGISRYAGAATLDAAEFSRSEVMRLRDASATANAGAKVIADDARAMLAAMTRGGR